MSSSYEFVEKMLECNPDVPDPDATIGLGRRPETQETQPKDIDELTAKLLADPLVRKIVNAGEEAALIDQN